MFLFKFLNMIEYVSFGLIVYLFLYINVLKSFYFLIKLIFSVKENSMFFITILIIQDQKG